MPWLATTGSVTPFIGLFGTVWGVMDAFSGLGTAGAASLRVVAPGIAEALITTAAGSVYGDTGGDCVQPFRSRHPGDGRADG